MQARAAAMVGRASAVEQWPPQQRQNDGSGTRKKQKRGASIGDGGLQAW